MSCTGEGSKLQAFNKNLMPADQRSSGDSDAGVVDLMIMYGKHILIKKKLPPRYGNIIFHNTGSQSQNG